MKELWDAYDREGKLVEGVILVRDEVIPKGLYHVVADVFVQHEDGSILLQKRDERKKRYPGFWATGAAGSVLRGESFLDGAKRELYEEVGIKAEDLEEIYTVFHGESMYKGYLCITNVPKDSVRLQEGETIDYKWVEIEEFLQIFYSEVFVDVVRERLKSFVQTRLEE